MRAITLGVIGACFLLAGRYAESKTSTEILIKFKPHIAQDVISQFTQEHHLEVIEQYPIIKNLFLCRLPQGSNIQEIMRSLNVSPEVEYAELNQKVEALK